MKDKTDLINIISENCLQIIAKYKVKMSIIAFEMGITLIDLYNILLCNNDDISSYLELYLLLNKKTNTKST